MKAITINPVSHRDPLDIWDEFDLEVKTMSALNHVMVGLPTSDNLGPNNPRGVEMHRWALSDAIHDRIEKIKRLTDELRAAS